ncbi:MAG: hypothetical protein ABSH22_06440 [Tepidisphaeraceae bacterium]|jgi:HTH-type transcriptional regulator/antitoxin HigA
MELVKRFPLVPIRSDRQLRVAYRIIDELSVIDEDKLTPGQGDYLDVLADLTVKYEEKHQAIDLSHLDAVDTLNHLMEQRGMTASDLGRLLGNREVGSKIIRRQRELSKAMIRKLADHFAVSAALFL